MAKITPTVSSFVIAVQSKDGRKLSTSELENKILDVEQRINQTLFSSREDEILTSVRVHLTTPYSYVV